MSTFSPGLREATGVQWSRGLEVWALSRTAFLVRESQPFLPLSRGSFCGRIMGRADILEKKKDKWVLIWYGWEQGVSVKGVVR